MLLSSMLEHYRTHLNSTLWDETFGLLEKLAVEPSNTNADDFFRTWIKLPAGYRRSKSRIGRFAVAGPTTSKEDWLDTARCYGGLYEAAVAYEIAEYELRIAHGALDYKPDLMEYFQQQYATAHLFDNVSAALT